MADERPFVFPTLAPTAVADTDWIPMVDVSDTTDSADGSDVKVAAWAIPRVRRLATTHAISATTGTEVTDLTIPLAIGTHVFEYSLLVQSATTTVGPMLGVNFTGTGNPRMIFYFADATTVITAAVHSMDDQGILGAGFIDGMANSAKTTTAPNMGTTVGVSTINVDIPCFIKGIVVVTVAGNLALWHSSETATSTSVMVGSSLVVQRTA